MIQNSIFTEDPDLFSLPLTIAYTMPAVPIPTNAQNHHFSVSFFFLRPSASSPAFPLSGTMLKNSGSCKSGFRSASSNAGPFFCISL